MKTIVETVFNIIHILANNSKFRYLIIGGVNTLFAISSSFLLIYVGYGALAAQFISNVCSMFFNYSTYRFFLYKSREGSIVKFIVNHIGNYLLSALILRTLLYYINNPYIASIIALVITIIINYLVLENIVFKKKDI